MGALAYPCDLPKFARWVGAGHVHLGELLGLYPVRKRLRGIGPRTVIDVGANTGQFSSAIAAILPEARIYAFEPIERCRRRCIRRMKGHPNFKSFNVGIGERAETREFNVSEFTESSSFLNMSGLHRRAFPWAGDRDQQRVHVVTLDSFIPQLTMEKPVLLKIDVQGFELPVLLGAREVLESVGIMVIETAYQPLYDGQALFGEIHEYLRAAGFNYGGSLQNLTDPHSGLILQADSIFLR